MTAHKSITAQPNAASQLDQIPQLYAVLAVVDQMAPAGMDPIQIPEEKALCRAYEKAPGIAKKSFALIADETVITATVGARALLDKGEEASVAAEELTRYLGQRIAQLGSLVGL